LFYKKVIDTVTTIFGDVGYEKRMYKTVKVMAKLQGMAILLLIKLYAKKLKRF
jgi:hypothetical protein